MAGKGQRFHGSEYSDPKPFIKIDGEYMFLKSVKNIEIEGAKFIFVTLKEYAKRYNLSQNGNFIYLDEVLNGPLLSALSAKHLINNDDELIICNSDQELVWDKKDFIATSRKYDGSVVIKKESGPRWSFAQIEDGLVINIEEKKEISDMALCGIHYFKKGADFIKYAEQAIADNCKANGEYYVAPIYNYAIKDGLKVYGYQISEMNDFGTPDALGYFLTKNKS
jgi:choline kinase